MTWICAGCATTIDETTPPFACPERVAGDGVDHVLTRVSPPAPPAGDHPNPFIAFRRRLWAWEAAQRAGIEDAAFVEMVEALDARITAVTWNGEGFRQTAATPMEVEGCQVWVKDETGSVGGSHKARHLMGVALYLEVAERAGWLEPELPLAIASCGNAALAAGVVARAARRRLRVFIPTEANPAVVSRLRELEAEIVICEREPGALGDPTYAAFQRAVAEGALPFCCQGPDCGLTIDGGRTLAWELMASAQAAGASLDRIFIQVGGGAFLSAVGQGLELIGARPAVHAVQTEGCYPLARAWERVQAMEGGLPAARRQRDAVMQPWPETPKSIAYGILDDETYDWAACVEAMQRTGGEPVVIPDAYVERAVALGRGAGVSERPVCTTGAAGFAGFLAARERGLVTEGETVGVVFSGAHRGDDLASDA